MNARTLSSILLLALTPLLAACHGSGGPSVKAANNQWFAAASSGSKADLDAALKSGDSVNAQESRNRYTPLHVAAMTGNVEAVKFILANGGNVDGVDEDGRTALMMSLYRSQGPAALALIDANANLEVRDRENKAALMFAAQYGQVDAINAMVKRHVNLDAQNYNGATALIFAADRSQAEAARALKAAGASTTLRDRRGRSALDFATAKHATDVIKVLRDQ